MIKEKHMYSYSTVSEALNKLSGRGYSRDFNINSNLQCLVCNGIKESLSPDDFQIDEIYRFEGTTDPGDEMIVYAISSARYQLKGTLVNAYGLYADGATSALVEKLKMAI